MSARMAILVCAFARVAGEPEPSASSSSRRSRPSCYVAPQLPVAPERRADPETDVRLAGYPRAQRERGADVVPLCVETLEPLALLWAEQARLGLLGKRDVEVGVPTPDGLAVAARRQTLERVLADGLEHSEARLVAACSFGREQVVPQERLDPLQDVEVGLLRDELGGAEREPADEDARLVKSCCSAGARGARSSTRSPPRSVHWRSVTPEPGAARRRSSLESRRSSSARGESRLQRAAASSRASGSPSRRTQSSTTDSAFVSESSKSGRAARARSTNSRIASVRRSRASDVRRDGSGSSSAGTG